MGKQMVELDIEHTGQHVAVGNEIQSREEGWGAMLRRL
jgi:hypothetical protein